MSGEDSTIGAGGAGGADGADGADGDLRSIVFYGSLLTGLDQLGKPDLKALGVRLVGPCRVRGLLYDTGLGWPALLEGEGEVRGELWQVGNPAAVLPVLDEFEEIVPGDPAASPYRRIAVTCLEPAGLRAWIYVWNRPVDGLAPVAHGDWRAWLDER